jgi:hypothetical protein
MEGQTSFENAEFRFSPPAFFNAKLHEGTVWRGVTWPNLPKGADEAGKFVDAYERLKQEMDRLKKHEDELNFFALELQSRRILSGNWVGIPIALYGLLCDYGRSYVRPLYGLLITVAVGVLPFWWHLGDGNDSFHEFTHRREGAQSVRFRRLSEKQFFVVTAGRHLVFPFLAVFLPTTKPEKSIADNITAAGFFRGAPSRSKRGCSPKPSPCVNWWKESLPFPGLNRFPLRLQAEAGATLLVGADPVIGDETTDRHGSNPPVALSCTFVEGNVTEGGGVGTEA